MDVRVQDVVGRHVSKLELKPGDIIVVKLNPSIKPDKAAAILDHYREAVSTSVAVVPDYHGVKVLSNITKDTVISLKVPAYMTIDEVASTCKAYEELLRVPIIPDFGTNEMSETNKQLMFDLGWRRVTEEELVDEYITKREKEST